MTEATAEARKPIRLNSLRLFISLRVGIATVVSCALLLAIATQVIGRKLYRDATEKVVRSAAIAASEHLDNEMYDRYRDLGSASVLLSSQTPDDAEWGRIIGHLHQAYSDYSWIALVAPDGMVRIANHGLLVGQSVAARPWFAQSLQDSYVGDVHEGVLLSKLLGPDADGQALRFVDFGFPLRNNNGEVTAILAAHLNWAWAKRVLAPYEASVVPGAMRDIMILDRNGIVLHGPAHFLGRKYDVPLPAEGVLSGEDFEGRVYAVARTKGYGNYPGLGWSVVIRASDSAVKGLVNALQATILWAGLPITVILLLTALLISRRIASPIERLTQAVVANAPIPRIQEYREAAELAEAFETLLEGMHHSQEKIEAEVVARTNELHDFLRVVDAHAIVSMSDGDGLITYANDHFCEASGYSRDELLGRNHNIVQSGRHSDALYDEMWTTITQGNVWQGTICNKTKDGREYWVRSTIAPTSSADSPHRYISIRTDITEVINDRERLAAMNLEQGLFKKIIESTTEAVTVADAEARVIYSNPARERLYGCTAAEMVGTTLYDVIPSSASHLIPLIREGVHGGTGWAGHLPLKRPDGTTFVSSSNIGVVKDGEGRVQFIFNVFHDFTLELAQRMELDNARHAAEMANRAKSEFLSNMSHELRTPLNAVIGFSQVLLSGTKNPLDEKQKAQLGYILAGGEHLLDLINEVLDLAKIEAGGMTLEVTPLHLRPVVEECLSLTKPMRDKYEVSLTDSGTGCKTMVRADPLRAKQLILNLLSNAAKYNRRGGSIYISCERVDGRFHRFVVADTGYGIPDAKQTEMFKPFSRLGAEATDIEGTGIGLVLTKTLIEAMGGRIGFSSVEGEGSCFWLDFPIVEAALAEPIGDRNGAFTSDGSLHFCAEDRLVLYVEDNPANLSLMEALFEQLAPMRLITASTGEEGLALAESRQPDVILLDINLPGMSGIEVVRQLKSAERTRHIPVVALSADATPQASDRAMEAGCDSYLTKPVDHPHLVRTLQHVMRHLDAQPV